MRSENNSLESIRYVDLVIPENNWNQKINDIKEFGIDNALSWEMIGRENLTSKKIIGEVILFT